MLAFCKSSARNLTAPVIKVVFSATHFMTFLFFTLLLIFFFSTGFISKGKIWNNVEVSKKKSRKHVVLNRIQIRMNYHDVTASLNAVLKCPLTEVKLSNALLKLIFNESA